MASAMSELSFLDRYSEDWNQFELVKFLLSAKYEFCGSKAKFVHTNNALVVVAEFAGTMTVDFVLLLGMVHLIGLCDPAAPDKTPSIRETQYDSKVAG